MNVNPKDINDFDDFVKAQVEKVSFDFDINHWKNLESELDKVTRFESSNSEGLNYKILFYITLSVLVTLFIGGVLYLNNITDPVQEVKTLETEPQLDAKNSLHSDFNIDSSDIESVSPDLTVPFIKKETPSPQESSEIQPLINSFENIDNDIETTIETTPESPKATEDSLTKEKNKKKYIIW